LHNGGSIEDQFTYTISDGSGGTATATVDLEVTGNDQNFSFALFAADETSFSAESDVAPIASSSEARRAAESRGFGDSATIQAIAAAVGLTGIAPHLAQADTHQTSTDQDPVLSEPTENHGWQSAAFADLGDGRESTSLQSASHPLAAPVQDSNLDHHADNLSDIIAQHFENLSSATGTDDSDSQSRSPAADGQEDADADAQGDSGTSQNTSQAQAASDHHDVPSNGHDGGWTGAPASPETAMPHLDGIVDFSNLPSFHAPVHDISPNASAIPDLKHGDFAGVIDFSRDLLPEPSVLATPDRGVYKIESAGTHAPVHETVHVAVNDIVQNMAHDAEAASNHHPH